MECNNDDEIRQAERSYLDQQQQQQQQQQQLLQQQYHHHHQQQQHYRTPGQLQLELRSDDNTTHTNTMNNVGFGVDVVDDLERSGCSFLPAPSTIYEYGGDGTEEMILLSASPSRFYHTGTNTTNNSQEHQEHCAGTPQGKKGDHHGGNTAATPSGTAATASAATSTTNTNVFSPQKAVLQVVSPRKVLFQAIQQSSQPPQPQPLPQPLHHGTSSQLVSPPAKTPASIQIATHSPSIITAAASAPQQTERTQQHQSPFYFPHKGQNMKTRRQRLITDDDVVTVPTIVRAKEVTKEVTAMTGIAATAATVTTVPPNTGNNKRTKRIHATGGTSMPNSDSNSNKNINNCSSSNDVTSEKVNEARKKMDSLLSAQREAAIRVEEAKQEIIQAQNKLKTCEAKKESVQNEVDDTAQELTDLLLQVKSNWNEMYKKLVEYKEEHGHCDVKRTLSPGEKSANPELVALGAFVGKVRLEARKPELERMTGYIEPYKLIALNRIGFDFDPRENYWLENYEKLKSYMAEHGRGKMPSRRKSSLGVWCDGQIIAYNRFMAGNPSYITNQKIDLLNKIGFVWDRNANNWIQKYKALKEFYDSNGHSRVCKNHPNQVLYRWVGKERTKYRNYLQGKRPCQTEDQFHLLKDLNFMEGKSISGKNRGGSK